MMAFKRHVTEYDGKEVLNRVNMWVEIQAYLDLPDTKQTKSKKENIAKDVYKSDRPRLLLLLILIFGPLLPST